MKEEEKYYTPSIEEFYVGFEYEWNNSNEDDIWRPVIGDNEFNFHAIVEIQNELDDINYRVKYLDKSDIEELGWFLDTNIGKSWYYSHVNNIGDKSLFAKTKDYYLDTTDFKEIVIHNDGDYDDRTNYFQGTIKNKSELKKLMQQIGIL